MDNITVHNIADAEDGLTAAFAYLIVGGWTGLLSGFVYAKLFGRKLIDPEFRGLRVSNRVMHKRALISGAIAAGSTLFLLWGNQLGDPSMLIALGNGVIVYTVLFEVVKDRISLSKIIVPAILTVIGGSLAAFNGSLSVTLKGILLVAVLSNLLDAFSEVVEQDGVRASDGVNLYLWRFFWLAATGTALGIAITMARGYSEMLLETMSNIVGFLPWVIATMFFVFLGGGIQLYIKKHMSISVILTITSTQILFGFPITILGDLIHENLFGDIPTDPSIWVIRFVGAICMVLGVLALRRTSSESG